MIKHLVMINFNKALDAHTLDAINGGFAALPEQIPQIRAYQFGVNVNSTAKNMDFGLIAEFESLEDFELYVNHPKHLAFINDVVGPHLKTFHTIQIDA